MKALYCLISNVELGLVIDNALMLCRQPSSSYRNDISL